MKLWMAPVGLFALVCAYGAWCHPVKPWIAQQYEDIRWLLDEFRLKRKHDLSPVAVRAVAGSLGEFSRVLDALPDSLRESASEFFWIVYPQIQALDVYRKDEWEYVG